MKKSKAGTFSQRKSLKNTKMHQFLCSRAVGKDEVASSNLASSSKKPDSFENQDFLRLFCSEILLSFFPDPPVDPREGKNAEKRLRERFKLNHPLGAFHCVLRTVTVAYSAVAVLAFFLPCDKMESNKATNRN